MRLTLFREIQMVTNKIPRAVVCPVCVSNSDTSTSQILNYARTEMAWTPYYDEEGRYHAHDVNYLRDWFKCSKDHAFGIAAPGCWCGWKASE